jgi:hypothetical protein
VEREEARNAAEHARARARLLVMDSLRLRVTATKILADAEAESARAIEIREELRANVSTYTVAMRHLGATPEQVIVTMKTLVNDAAHDAVLNGLSPDLMRTRLIRDDLVRWAIDCYYAGAQ